jgi:preprotein translocase subunit YajC
MDSISALAILAQEDSAGSPIISLGILLLIPAAMYFLMIRPQRRRMKDQQALQRSIEVGDEVVTTSGLYGFITGEDGDKFWLEIDDDVQIRIARAAVQARVNPSDPAGDESAGASSDDTAKTDGQ